MTREHLVLNLGQYRGFVFRWQKYAQPSKQWSHDHCGGCMATFAERPWNEGILTEGWVTLWPIKERPDEENETLVRFRSAGYVIVSSPKIRGFQLDWVCPDCFESVREELAFAVDPNHPQWEQAGL
jgi:hypothetical protein